MDDGLQIRVPEDIANDDQGGAYLEQVHGFRVTDRVWGAEDIVRLLEG